MSKIKKYVHRLATSRLGKLIANHKVHLFPVAVLILFVVLVGFRISGTSIGIYYSYLYGSEAKDPSLIIGKPQAIRSDEWLVATQLTIAQDQDGYRENNENYSEPKDLGFITDAPYMGWSSIFKPQNLSFFLMPIEFAFAFKWWLLILSLVVSCYYFMIRMTNRRIVLSILASITISYSPFVFWWYQTATIAPLTYGFLILILSMSIIDKRKWRLPKKISQPFVKSLLLSYFLVSFILVLYPPFQIPIVFVVTAFILGYLLNKKAGLKKSDWRRIILGFLGSVILAASICGVYFSTHTNELQSVTNTAYPGKREVLSGGYKVENLLVTYLQPQLQREGKGAQYIQNQSESSSFILLPLFFLLPALALSAWLYRKKRHIDWLLVALLACTFLFLAHLFIPLPLLITKLFLLHMVPHSRLLIGLGMLGIIMGVYTALLFAKQFKPNRKLFITVALYTLIYLVVIVIAGLYTSTLYPSFISSKKLIVLLAGISLIGPFLLLIGKLRVGMSIVALFSVLSVFAIHPLYVGLGPIYKSTLTEKVRSVSKETSVWAVAEDIFLENVPQMSDREAITGVNPYPSNNFWKKYTDQESVYNRYAHIFLSDGATSTLKLVQPDLFAVSSSCSLSINGEIDYILTSTPMRSECATLIDTVKYPARSFYIYAVDHKRQVE